MAWWQSLQRRLRGSEPLTRYGPPMRIGVAATAPFGADVLERLASVHEVAFLLTRPDAPKGRGRKLASPPAKEVAERLGLPVLQPERPGEAEFPGVDAIVVAAYGLLIPESLARPDALAQRPPLAASALAWCGAGGARDHGRRRRDGRHDPRDREGARRRADRRAARLPDRGGGRRGRRVRAGGRAGRRAARRGAAVAAASSRSPRTASRTPRRSAPTTGGSTSPTPNRPRGRSGRSRRTSAPAPSSTAAASPSGALTSRAGSSFRTRCSRTGSAACRTPSSSAAFGRDARACEAARVK